MAGKEEKRRIKKISLYTSLQNSMGLKLAIILSAFSVLMIVVIILVNIIFLPRFYANGKMNTLSKAFKEINSTVSEDTEFTDDIYNNALSEKSVLSIEKIESDDSSNIYLFEITKFLDSYYYNFDYPTILRSDDVNKKEIINKTADYIAGLSEDDKDQDHDCIYTAENYKIFKVYDDRIGSDFMELFGRLDCGTYLYMRTNYESISESAAISNKFILWVGIIMCLIEVILLVIISRRFTRPLKNLTEIAGKMAELDFDAKYETSTRHQDEIDRLGSSMNSLSNKLEQTISELKTANNELQNDIEKKTRIDQMRQEFLSNVSHELKTPIALIQGYAEGLSDNVNDDPESRKFYADVIVDESHKMNNMVKKLLTLSQIESGENQIEFNRFDIISVIQSVVDKEQLLADKKGTDIYIKAEGPVYVWADEYFTEEVLTNYVTNAVNHVEKVNGRISIEISIEESDGKVRVKVFNTGRQIPEEDLDRIWQKFYKVDKARTREYGGSGIGLSIVNAIMKAMNEKCGVNNLDDGVLFWFELDKNNQV
ncbi:MAG: HAMP domain-containing sensor histidine kinase [Lachnospiraceae bacterium]|jgi:two-component system sensor histidine kinase VanS|nr:HAMP domain-containing sensor histidine kinase [Lachnospiraceae bacterium]MEE3461381.1 HAMP domain-containing sensor histidine kinase [Lachnospiraceae bacterium]